MNKRLYVGNLDYGVTNETLAEYFAQAGKVENAEVISYEASGRSKGFGFVEMATEEEAQAAIKKFDGVEHEGRTLSVEPAQPKKDREETENVAESKTSEEAVLEEDDSGPETEEVEAETETEAEVEPEEAKEDSEPVTEEAKEDETGSEEASEEADTDLQ